MRYRFFGVFFLLAACAAGSRAADAPLSLDQLVAEALSRNPELLVFESGIAAARGDVSTAVTRDNPELSFAPGIKNTKDSGAAFHANVELTQSFKSPAKRAVAKAIAEGNVELQQLALDAFRQQLGLDVRKSYYQLMAARRVMALRGEQVKSARDFAAAAEHKAKSGYSSDFEAARGAAEVIAAQKKLREAEADATAATVSLNALMGREPLGVLSVAGELSGGVPPALPASRCVAVALATNASLRVLAKESEQAERAVRAAKLEQKSDYAIGPQLEYTPDEQVIGIGFSMALPWSDKKAGLIMRAAAEWQKTQAELAKTRAAIAGAVTLAAGRYDAAREASSLYTPELLARLKAVVDQAEQAVANNATTLLVYFEAKRTYFDALADYYETLSTLAETRAELEAAMGAPLN